MKKLFQKSKQAAQKLIAATFQKELLTARAAAAREALFTDTGKRTLADGIGSIAAAFNSLLVNCYQLLFSFTVFTLSQVQAQIEDLKTLRDEYERERALHQANLNGYASLSGVLLRSFLFVLTAVVIATGDVTILSSALQLFTTNLLSALLLSIGVCVSLLLLPALSCILAQRASSVRWRRLIEWGSFLFVSLIFVLLIYARRSFDEATGQEQDGSAYLFYYGFNLLSYVVLHLMAKLLLLPVLNDLKEAWARHLEKRKIKKLTHTINHINNQIAAKQEEADLLINADAVAVLMEEQIARLYSQVVAAFREAYRTHARYGFPDWMADEEPNLDFIVKGKQPLKATSASQDRFTNTRTSIGFKIIGLTALIGLSSCSLNEPKPTRFVGILYDQTAYDTLHVTGRDVLKLSGLHEDHDRGVEVRIVTITAKQFSSMCTYSLESVSALTSNATKRPGAVALFERGIDSLMDAIPSVSNALKDSSRIFYKLSQVVREFVACSLCSEGVIVAQTDMMEFTGLFSSYADINSLTSHHPQVVEILQTAYPLPKFTKPLRIIITHNPPLSQEAVFAFMIGVLKDYFARSNVTVEVTP
ncbi:MAG: hypothetical protein F9K23_08560 [Bacteroidetes bacterium]|nr:MAG: hypothetical protein F9K23_08560 [Bacteroidota bacterium]